MKLGLQVENKTSYFLKLPVLHSLMRKKIGICQLFSFECLFYRIPLCTWLGID